MGQGFHSSSTTAAVCVALFLACFGCGGSGGSSVSPESGQVSSLLPNQLTNPQQEGTRYRPTPRAPYRH